MEVAPRIASLPLRHVGLAQAADRETAMFVMLARVSLTPGTLTTEVLRAPMTSTISASPAKMALNGLSTVDDGAFVQIVPTPLRSMIDTHAPSAQPGAKLFDPKKVPSMGYSDPRPQTKIERDLERWQKAFFAFMRLNGTRNSSAQHLLELYASLTDKRAEPSKEYEASPIWFHVRTPLTKSELLYAIETTFALNNLEIAAGEENTVRLGPKMGPGKGVPTTHETRAQ